MAIKLKLIAAVCENMGIGKNGDLPWRLKKEMAYFTRMTSETTDKSKKNVVLLGRSTWNSIPKKYKPLSGRINFVLSRSKLDLSAYNDAYSFTSLEEVISKLEDDKFQERYENVWVIGGSQIYELAMKSRHFHSLYLTKILKNYDCDTFFPEISDDLLEIKDSNVPDEIQEENGVQFIYSIYKNPNFSK